MRQLPWALPFEVLRPPGKARVGQFDRLATDCAEGLFAG